MFCCCSSPLTEFLRLNAPTEAGLEELWCASIRPSDSDGTCIHRRAQRLYGQVNRVHVCNFKEVLCGGKKGPQTVGDLVQGLPLKSPHRADTVYVLTACRFSPPPKYRHFFSEFIVDEYCLVLSASTVTLNDKFSLEEIDKSM